MMKYLNLKILPLIFMVILFCSCSKDDGGLAVKFEATIDSLMIANSSLQSDLAEKEGLIASNQNKLDSLAAYYHSQIEAMEDKKALTPTEKKFSQLVFQINNAISRVQDSKKTDEILSFFNDQYTTNIVEISISNEVNVKRGATKTFPEQLQFFIDNSHLITLKTKLKKILKVEVRNDELGVLLYLNETNAVKANGDKLRYESLVQIVAKNFNGVWKIGNYSSIMLTDVGELPKLEN
ncbi:hypothetical protein [Flexithrix dorotheae]|uniref:hypothetical protein n=1 Tax=Flexithrix dorotheae TaxID=70993 RepID=UPI0012F82F7F|nr:hypothetical protein [Flexithrix dorotheae]